MFSHNVLHYQTDCFRNLVLAWSLQALKLAEGEVFFRVTEMLHKCFVGLFIFKSIYGDM